MISGALIGDPVEFSISHIVYPEIFKKYDLEGSFKKINIPQGQLGPFFSSAPTYDFITVTMPHKVDVVPFCHFLSEDAKNIGSVNFISQKEGFFTGRNYDGIAALDAIEHYKPVNSLHVVVYGAGGAGKAAIYEAKKRGAFVTVFNRTLKKGEIVAKELNVAFSQNLPQCFDVLINATSVGMDPRQSFDLFDDTVHFTNTIVLDMASRNKDSILKKRVEKSLGIYISGVDMFQRLTILGFSETCKQLHLSIV